MKWQKETLTFVYNKTSFPVFMIMSLHLYPIWHDP